MKKIFTVGFIVFTVLLTRIAYLNTIPTTYSHDEFYYQLNAQAVAETGRDITGKWHPLSLTPVAPTLAELMTVFLSPFYLIHGLNPLIAGRLLFVFYGMVLPLILGSISYKLFNSKQAAFFTIILGWLNPWIWQNSRLTFDIMFSLFWYSAGIATYLWSKPRFSWLSLPLFFIGFYSYQGFKLVLLPIVGSLILYSLIQSESSKWKESISRNLPLLIGALIIFIVYVTIQLPAQSTSKDKLSGQLLSPMSQVVIDAVNMQRRIALESQFTPIFSNKYSVWLQEVINRYLYVFSPKSLFTEVSASSSSFAVWTHGMFYLLDAVLMMLGSFCLLKRPTRKRLAAATLLGLLAITAGIPSAVSISVWLYFRTSILLIVFLVLAGYGAHELKKHSNVLFFGFLIFYLFSVVRFGYVYFIRYPVFASENIFFSPRLIVEYANRSKTESLTVYDPEPEFTFANYVFYNNLISQDAIDAIRTAFRNKEYAYEQFSVVPCLPDTFSASDLNNSILKSTIEYCNPAIATVSGTLKEQLSSVSQPPLYIKNIKDSGDDYIILNDSLCNEHRDSLSVFSHPTTISQFNLASLSTETFCKSWIHKGLIDEK